MFCRSCWANLPDGTAECPKCHRDPRIAGAPPAAPLAPPAIPRGAPASRLPGLARLNLVLAAGLAVAILGPPGVRWWEARRAAPPRPPVEARGDPTTSGRPPLETGFPDAGQPAAPRGGGAEVRPEREAYALFQQGQIAAACERYRELAARADREETRRSLAGCYARLGRDAYQAGRPAEAAERYQAALDTVASREHWIGLLLSHAKAGELARAQRSAEQALRAFPDDPELLYLLAEVQERQGRSRDALETVRRLLARDPSHARGRQLQATLEREQRVEAGYWSQESAHFLVRYEGGGGIEVGRAVADVLEQAYESLGRELGVYPKDRVQVGIYVTKTFAEIGGIPPEYAEHVLGFYDFQKLRLRLSASQAQSYALERLVRHEYAHLLIHTATSGRAPRWLHEGLAQVVEPRAAPRFVEVSVALDRQHFTLDGLEGLFRTNAVGVAYQLAHVIADWLVEQRGMAGMRAFLGRLGQGEALPLALREAFGLSREDLDARLLAAGGRS
jgi:tetratricopeptide (TPR) repeat protein